jgi:hypothetical protein
LTFTATVTRRTTRHLCSMENKSNYKRIIGIITITAGVLAAACMFVGAHAVEYNFEAFSEPTLLMQYAHNYKAAYLFLLLDMAGYYLLLLPVIFYIHQQFKFRSPWVPLLSFCGLAYVLTGAIGAAMLAAAWPELMQQYTATAGVGQETISLLFNTITNVVTKGLWNILEVLFAATWWIGVGILLFREYKVIGLLSIIAGTACLIDAISTMASWKVVSEVGLNIYILLGIVWPVVVGIHLLRKPVAQTRVHDSSTINFSSSIKKDTYEKA